MKKISSKTQLKEHLIQNHGGTDKDDFDKTNVYSNAYGRYGSVLYAHPRIDGKKDNTKVIGHFDEYSQTGELYDKPKSITILHKKSGENDIKKSQDIQQLTAKEHEDASVFHANKAKEFQDLALRRTTGGMPDESTVRNYNLRDKHNKMSEMHKELAKQKSGESNIYKSIQSHNDLIKDNILKSFVGSEYIEKSEDETKTK